MDRRLAAILHADVVGYSRLMEGAETRTFRELKMLFDKVWLPALARHYGRLVNTAGDAMLVEFGSAVAAVRCAMELQVAMAARNADRPIERHVTLRIGLNIGEVIVDGDNIFGDEVNIAARIQALAEPGTVIVSTRVRDAVEGKVGFSFSDLGDQQVKNISRPVHVHRVLPADVGADAATVLPVRLQASAPAAPEPAPAFPPSRPAPSQPHGPQAQPASVPMSWSPPQPPPAQPTPLFEPPPAGGTPPPPMFPPGQPPAFYGSQPLSTPTRSAIPPPFVPAPLAPAPMAWRLMGTDRIGTPVDVRLDPAQLEHHEGVVFGRLARYCHVTVDNDSISRRHARFKVTAGGTLTVEDFGSTNGTAVDGHRIEAFRPVPLRDGARVSLGEIKVIVSRS